MPPDTLHAAAAAAAVAATNQPRVDLKREQHRLIVI